MINTCILEGKLVSISELKETDKGIKYASLRLEVVRAFRNSDGQYDSDLIDVDLWRGVAETCTKYATVGDIIGIQARIQSSQLSTADGRPFLAYGFVAEKVSFLSTQKN